MTPKEKAKELVDKMYNTPHCGIEHFPSKHYCDCSEIGFFQAKQCALIAVDEIIASMPKEPMISTLARVHVIMFWVEIKQEIEKL
jgi:hypothetical protein